MTKLIVTVIGDDDEEEEGDGWWSHTLFVINFVCHEEGVMMKVCTLSLWETVFVMKEWLMMVCTLLFVLLPSEFLLWRCSFSLQFLQLCSSNNFYSIGLYLKNRKCIVFLHLVVIV
jgi:hypothetical protein